MTMMQRDPAMKTFNFAAYKYIYLTRMQKTLAYRFDVFAGVLFQCIVMFASSFFWKALYADTASVQGVSVDDMLTYTVVSAVMSVFLTPNVEQRVIESVDRGAVAADMLKPIRLYGEYLAEDLGIFTSRVFLDALPILLIASLCIKVPKPASCVAFLLFLASFAMSFFIAWLLSAIFSMWAFTLIDMSALVQVKRHLIRLLSGSIIPVWFFPGWLANSLRFLPFIYIYQLPLELYIGKGSLSAQLPKMGMQAVWLFLLLSAFLLLEKRTLRNVLIQGG